MSVPRWGVVVARAGSMATVKKHATRISVLLDSAPVNIGLVPLMDSGGISLRLAGVSFVAEKKPWAAFIPISEQESRDVSMALGAEVVDWCVLTDAVASVSAGTVLWQGKSARTRQ